MAIRRIAPFSGKFCFTRWRCFSTAKRLIIHCVEGGVRRNGQLPADVGKVQLFGLVSQRNESLLLGGGERAALAGAFVEGALTQENVEIPGFQLLRRKGLPQLALGAEDGADFLRHHVLSYRCDVLAAPIPLARGVQRVLQQHFSHGAVAFFDHESPVFADGGQKLTVLLRGFGFAVGAKAAPLCNMQYDTNF